MERELTLNKAQSGSRVLMVMLLALALMAAPAGSRELLAERATTSPAMPTASMLPAIHGNRRVRVQIFLADNSLESALTDTHAPLAGHMRGAAAAKSEALRSPARPTGTERRIAATMDDQRNTQLPRLRAAAKRGTSQSERVAAVIARLGGNVIDANALPNSITASVPARALPALNMNRDVTQIAVAPRPIWASSPVDGSETWQAAGYTGGGSSADGNGGPDYLAFDMGVTTAHQAFRTRLPGDSPTGLGTGPTRVISPAGRSDFVGSGHGNNIAGIVASTDLRVVATSGPPYPPTWQNYKGLAYGLDKLYDNYQAKSANRWEIGVAYQGEPGVSDLPEVLNYSAGLIEDTTDYNSGWSNVDTEVSEFGITQTISAGNCGIADPFYTNCGDGPHRVETPGNLYNVITLGGLSMPDPYDSSTWTVWPNSSSGPTWGGRKKPDLIAPSSAGPCPANWNVNGDGDPYNDYDNCGQGTSNSAPQAAAGAILLASTGVYKPATQKAILINTAAPIQGQTYWMPRSGWGALNLAGAFIHRGDYEDGFVTAAGANSARFFRQNSVAAGDKTTLVWNRRATHLTGGFPGPLYMTLTNLDLFQFAAADACSPSCTPTATGGVDANDTVDTNQTVTADNPMPGNGTDGEDNVEQVHSTGTGTQIIKVKAMSTIDGATEEPFSLAANHALTALQTPIPTVTLAATPTNAASGEAVTISAQVDNPSADLALSGAQVTLTLPSGVSLTSGSLTQSLGTIPASGTTTVTWPVSGVASGSYNLNATATGTTYGETFSGQGGDSFIIDADPPVVSVVDPGTWSTAATPQFTWSATDASGVATYDVEVAHGGGAFTPLLTATTATSAGVTGSEGELVSLRVRATDTHGNTSGWTSAETTIDAIPPAVSIGTPSFPAKNVVNAFVSATNVGAPLTSSYVFSGGSALGTFSSSATASFTNHRATAYTTTLTVTTIDALGRTASAAQTFSVPSPYTTAELRIKSAKIKAGTLKLRGTVTKAFHGKVTVRITRVGRVGTKRFTKRVSVRRGRFALTARLKLGKYRVRVSSSTSGMLLAGAATKTVRVR